MNAARFVGTWAVLLAGGAALLPNSAIAQEGQPARVVGVQDVLDQAEEELAPSKTLRPSNVGTIRESTPPATVWSNFLPALSGMAVAWIAVVAILLLTLQLKPLMSWHNLDGLILALTALLVAFRASIDAAQGDSAAQHAQWWTYLLFCLVGLYWLARGAQLLFAKAVPALRPNVSGGAMFILILAGLFVAGGQIINAPLSDGSRDGLIGGVCTAETGKLPYGDALGHDARSPLLYLIHAGAVKLTPPSDAAGICMRWANRSIWLDQPRLETADLKVVRLINALLFVLLLAALAGIGHRLHSVSAAQTLLVIACVFPGVLECSARPEIMLPAVLVAWSVAFALLPRVGGLLSVLTMVLAGLAWPWAWLALPALLAYFFRHGWQALGATGGLLIGLAALLVGATILVAPALPRSDGALHEAGITPAYAARLSNDGTPVIEHYRPDETATASFKRWIWNPLLNQDELRLSSASTQPALPNGVDANAVMYRDVVATGPARDALQLQYREALSQQPETVRASAALRTLLEATWKPEVAPVSPVVGVWELWATNQPVRNWTLARRAAKIAVGLLALLAAFVLIRGRPARLHELIGALLAICSATLLISMTGPATNWVWLMPTALAALATRTGSAAPAPETPMRRHPPIDLGPAPRITVDR
jgi:hypothetical protein